MSANPKKITAIKTLQRKLDMDDGIYRDVLHKLTGRNSCTAMTEPQLNRVLEYLHDLDRKMFGASAGQISLVRHIWDRMYQFGIVNNNHAAALDTYCRRMVRQPLARCTPAQCQRLIECLKKWWRRAANPVHIAALENMLAEQDMDHVIQ